MVWSDRTKLSEGLFRIYYYGSSQQVSKDEFKVRNCGLCNPKIHGKSHYLKFLFGPITNPNTIIAANSEVT